MNLCFTDNEVSEFPGIVNIEIYRGGCFCRCKHCPVGLTEPQNRKNIFGERGMDIELFKKIGTELSRHPDSLLRLHSVGEPIIWKDIVEALSFCRSLSVKTWVFTSAASIDKNLLQAVCFNTDIIEISVNSVSPENYILTKGIDAFNIVFDNIKMLHYYIKKEHLTTRILVSRVQSADEVMDHEFVDFWKTSGLVHDAFIRSFHTYNNLINGLGSANTEKHSPCLVHWSRFNISVDGNAVICFNELFKKDIHTELILGNLWREDIIDIWKGQKLKAIRSAELSGDYAQLSFGEILPCKDCRYCQTFQVNKNTSEHQIQLIGKTHD